MRSFISLSLVLTIFDSHVNALSFPFDVRFAEPAPSITRREVSPIRNIGNAQYVSNVTVAGVTLPVLLDTGRCAGAIVLWRTPLDGQPKFRFMGQLSWNNTIVKHERYGDSYHVIIRCWESSRYTMSSMY